MKFERERERESFFSKTNCFIINFMDFLNVRIKIKNKTTSFWTLNVCHLTGIKKTSKLNKTKS